MTVSTINGVTTELRRTQDNINKQERPLPLQPSNASLPDDVVAGTALAAAQAAGAGADTAERVAAQNREAARSSLSDADIDAIVSEQGTPSQQVARTPEASVAAQTSKLPPKILDLLAE